MEVVLKDRNELVENRNYEIAIEVSRLESSISRLRDEVVEKDERIMNLEMEVKNYELRIDLQRLLLVDQLSYVSKVHERPCSVVKIVDDDKKSQLDLTD